MQGILFRFMQKTEKEITENFKMGMAMYKHTPYISASMLTFATTQHEKMEYIT